MITARILPSQKLLDVIFLLVIFAFLNGCTISKDKEAIISPSASATLPASGGESVKDSMKSVASGKETVTQEGRDFVLAARFGQENAVRDMLNHGARINSRDELGNTALIAAASEGHKGMVALLLAQGAVIDTQSHDGTTALMAATVTGNTEIAKSLISAGAKIDIGRNNGETALFDATIYGHGDLVELLIAQGADPNIQNRGKAREYHGYTPLMYAAQGGFGDQGVDWLGMARILLKNGAMPNVARDNGDTALSIALRNGYADIVSELRKLGAHDELQYAGLAREEALIIAAKLNDAVKTRELLEGAARPNYRNNITGVSPLLTACYYGHTGIVHLLVEFGADVNNVPWGLTDQRIVASSISVNERELLYAAANGDTALITAIRKDFPEISAFLLAHGAAVNLVNRKEEMPSLVAAQLGRAKIMAQLLAKGADPNSSQPMKKVDPFVTGIKKQDDIDPLLIEATVNGHTDTVEALLAAGADPNLNGQHNKTALYWAVSQGFLNTVNTLLSHKADTNIKDDIGTTPLMVAAKNGYKKIVELLLENGAEINAIEGIELEFGSGESKAGMTALIYAARGGHAEIVRLLLTKGADAGLTTSSGESALGAAKSNGHADVVQVLTGLSFD